MPKSYTVTLDIIVTANSINEAAIVAESLYQDEENRLAVRVYSEHDTPEEGIWVDLETLSREDFE